MVAMWYLDLENHKNSISPETRGWKVGGFLSWASLDDGGGAFKGKARGGGGERATPPSFWKSKNKRLFKPTHNQC